MTTESSKQAEQVPTPTQGSVATEAPTRPSAPISMLTQPEDRGPLPSALRFEGELDDNFEAALARVDRRAGHSRWRRALDRLVGRGRQKSHADRAVAFDGFRTELHDQKRERDRRYGTVYTVREERNAYLVRLEMPRLLPVSGLREVWKLPQAMADYNYALHLSGSILTIRAGTAAESVRRLSYISGSFPADFMTRVEFASPVRDFAHRLHNKVLEIIVFKRER